VTETQEYSQLGDFHEDCRNLDADAFAGRHGDAFLIHHGPIGILKSPQDQDKTMNFEFSTTDPRMAFNPRNDYLVFPVRTSLANTAEENIRSIGRNETNEIVVPDMTISGIHAFLMKREDGDFHLQDMNSTNGTSVNGVPVPAQGEGEPVRLKSGDRIRFGGVKFTFLRLEEFRSLIAGIL
jgi:pSer/pThr/pTyr-binding forkhead associated (FHA) protein